MCIRDSYISEVPVWKTTYRIVLPSKNESEPLLQGWAIVDNTVGEDWSNVELSLVAGAPQSFIQQLSQPYYARRPVVPLPQNAEPVSYTHLDVYKRQAHIPQFYRFVGGMIVSLRFASVQDAGTGRKKFSVGTESHCVDFSRVAGERAQFAARCWVPQFYRFIAAS